MALTLASDPYVRAGTTIRDYIRGAENLTARRRLEVALLKKYGRIKYNCGGDGFQWQAEFQQGTVQDNNGAQSVTPSPVDRYRTAFLTYEGAVNHDRITKREKLMNEQSSSRLVDQFKDTGKKLLRELEEHFCQSMYTDGPANPGKLSGLQSFTGYTQTLQANATTPTARTANAADPLGVPSDTYATISCALGGVAGSWTGGDYVTGQGTSSYDFWAPIIIRMQSTYFGGSTLAANIVEALKLGVMLNLRQKPQDGGCVDTVLTSNNVWFTLSNRQDAKERVTVSEAWKMPHYGMDQDQGVIIIDGTRVTWTYDCPASRGFGVNWQSVQFRSMQDSLFQLDPKSPEWFSRERSFGWIADYLGQWKFRSPRDFVYYDNNY